MRPVTEPGCSPGSGHRARRPPWLTTRSCRPTHRQTDLAGRELPCGSAPGAVKIVVFNNGGIGPGHAEHPKNPLQNLKPNALIYGARYDKMMEAFGGKGWFVENPKDLKSALEAAMAFGGPALVNVMISQESARKPQQFRWHS